MQRAGQPPIGVVTHQQNYSYRAFWAARSTTCFWVAEQGGYRVGAFLAQLAAHLKMTPDTLSFLALILGAGAPLLVAFLTLSPLAEGGLIFTGLFVAYWLDCADGMLARVTAQTSSFGAVLDKVVDFLVASVATAALGMAALAAPAALIPASWRPGILVFSLLPKASFSVLSWLKDSHLHGFDHSRNVEVPASLSRRLRRLIGNITDDVPWRLGLTISWATGWFWEFTLSFNLLMTAVFVGYGWAAKREMDAHDRAAKRRSDSSH